MSLLLYSDSLRTKKVFKLNNNLRKIEKFEINSMQEKFHSVQRMHKQWDLYF
jgi:hypothetical protein